MDLIRTHDGLFKFVFGEPAQMAELLRACLPAAVAEAIDWSTLQRAPASFVDRALKGRHTDLLFTALLGRSTVLLYVVSEHKSADDRFTTWQVACYVVRILEQWLGEQDAAERLPAVLPLVVYHGDHPWRAPRSPHELVDVGGCSPDVTQFLLPLQLHLPFCLLDLAGLDEPRIEAMRLSAVSGLTLRFLQFLRACPLAESGALIRRWQHLIRRLLEHPRGQDVLFALLSWYIAGHQADRDTLRTVMTQIREENPPMRSCLDLLLEMGEERGVAKGVQQGIQQGRQQGLEQGLQALRTLLEEQLRARFDALPADLGERLAQADAELLRRWGLRLVTASAIDDVFAI